MQRVGRERPTRRTLCLQRLGSGQCYPIELGYRRRLEGQICVRLLLSVLPPTNQAQYHTEPRFGEEATVLGVGDLPYLAQYRRRHVGLLEEGDGALAGHDAQGVAVGKGEEV